MRTALLWLSLLATGWVAGFFYAYSFSVMPGLDATEPANAIRAMQGINACVRTPVFAFAFFGSLVLPLLAAVAGRWQPRAGLALAAALIYGAGAFAVTFIVNVPMNEALAIVDPDTAGAAATWQGYTVPWTLWNHLRTGASTLAFLVLALAIRTPARPVQ
ncbi:DUF1772 domain-containing protein [Humitalea sp. 24SJ18S-53]|uniref:anthrone oxygenase family protein n=1 Tax=Humitalea sp. 24SJ18S-53 TaxID=3422307 RepID=UPI003D66C0C5